ncbi:undecaprenyl-phosphate glucose phosphotransferase [Candidatus Vecturithrix granuli]|uniref:Undecaprenyl-phosphate glucose phosphotransferase n=1 Tax=Vecturithrix granuli TaxID=1499967 RepID=A0A081BXN1_VECG1|nr:undecaprenyl-phosphate glucose phosphotransferase [Candidatus Vecturithrix granuli]
MKLLITLVNYKTTDLLLKCLESIQQQKIHADYRIVVIDNNSQDGGMEYVKKAYPEIVLIENGTNNGYAIAVNQAIRLFDSDYILLLNPDIEVKPGAIDALVKFMDATPDVGITGGKLFYPDGRLQYSCRTFFSLPVILYRRTFLGKLFPESSVLKRHLMADWDHETLRDVDWVLGACMLIRRSALKDVGLMDERFFLYFEDVDWCYRMKKGGWRVCYLPQAKMIHHHRRESANGMNKTLFFHIMSMFHFYDKWGNFLYFLRKYRVILGIMLFILLDVASINLSFVGAYFIRKSFLNFLAKPQLPFSYYYDSLLFTNIVMPLVFYSLGLYKIKSGELWVDELFRVGKGVLVSIVFLMAGSYLAQGYEFSRTMKLVFAGLCIILMFASRWFVVSRYQALRKKGFNLRRTLIVGADRTAATIHKELRHHCELGFDIVGFVQEPGKQKNEHIFPILGTIEHLPDLIKTHNITELILTNTSDSRDVIARCKRDGVNVRLVTNLYNLSMHETSLEELAGIPMVHFKGKPLFAMKLVLKRAIDVLLGGLALLTVAPFMAIIALLIKLDSSGPVFITEIRLGQDQKPFAMYKFRSQQVQTTRSRKGRMYSLQPELTRIGMKLRRYRLDLLPQFLNVLKGEMSLVGPRPLPLKSNIAQYNGWRQERFDIKPGMTGLWQVSAQQEFSDEEMMRLDMYYIWNWSFSNDVKILLRTIPMIFSHPKYISSKNRIS